jgi:hypothetical protein
MINKFYDNFLNFFNNPNSLKDLIEIKNYYDKNNLTKQSKVFEDIIENVKFENNSSNFISR